LHWMPERRADLDPSPEVRMRRRQMTTEPVRSVESDRLKSLTKSEVDTVITPADDGLAAWLVRLPPNSIESPPRWAPDGGRFYSVTRGSARVDAQSLPRLSAIWVSDESEFKLHAGGDGLEVLALQFPVGVPSYLAKRSIQ